VSGGKRGPGTGRDAIRTLTDTQQRFLEAFFRDSDESESFYLTGGTALAGFYLHHRYSDDLDFFTRSEGAVAEVDGRIVRAATAIGLVVERVERWPRLSQFFLSGDPIVEHRLVKIDVASDPEPYSAPPQRFDQVLVDALLSIAVNKVAIITRDEAKDYVDLYTILHETSFRLTDLIPLAKQRLLGLDEWAIADKFRRVRRVLNVAEYLTSYMVRPVDWRALVQYYEDRAEELTALFPPKFGDFRDHG
jgi:predicted nucleotidyltransferase component of viral defense system